MACSFGLLVRTPGGDEVHWSFLDTAAVLWFSSPGGSVNHLELLVRGFQDWNGNVPMNEHSELCHWETVKISHKEHGNID